MAAIHYMAHMDNLHNDLMDENDDDFLLIGEWMDELDEIDNLDWENEATPEKFREWKAKK